MDKTCETNVRTVLPLSVRVASSRTKMFKLVGFVLPLTQVPFLVLVTTWVMPQIFHATLEGLTHLWHDPQATLDQGVDPGAARDPSDGRVLGAPREEARRQDGT